MYNSLEGFDRTREPARYDCYVRIGQSKVTVSSTTSTAFDFARDEIELSADSERQKGDY